MKNSHSRRAFLWLTIKMAVNRMFSDGLSVFWSLLVTGKCFAEFVGHAQTQFLGSEDFDARAIRKQFGDEIIGYTQPVAEN